MQSMTQERPKWTVLFTLSMIPIIMVLGNSMLIPVLPTVGSVYQVSTFQVSLLITLFSIPAAIMIPIAGILADRIGRKKVIFFSLLLYGIGGLMAGISVLVNGGSYWFLLTSRIVQGIGAAGTAPIVLVLVSDLYQRQIRGKALGIIESANAMGKVLSPILGSLIALITWYSMFFIFPALCVPVSIALWFLVKEPNSSEPLPLATYRQHVKKIFKRHGRWMSVVFFVGLVTMFTTFGVLFYLSEILEGRFRIEGMMKGLVLAIPLLGLCATAYFTGSKIKDRIGLMKRLIQIGLSLMALFLFILPWTQNIYLLLSFLFMIGVGTGLILPCLNTLITSAIGIHERGIITSLYGSVRFFGVALGPPVFGALLQSPFILFIGTTVFIIIACILSTVFIHQPQRLRGNEGHTRLIMRKKRLHPTTG